MTSKNSMFALLAVLMMSCAALAGTAYAYTATYVDTIDSQDVEAVYLSVSSVKDGEYGEIDLDLEYDSYNNGSSLFYRLWQACIGDESTAMTSVDGNRARFCLLIDTVTITAVGDDATISKVSASYPALADADHGATAFIYLSKTPVAAVPSASGYSDLAMGTDVTAGQTATVYAYIVIDVQQIGGTACTDTGFLDYYPATAMGNAVIPGFSVAFKAEAEQKAVPSA